LTDVRRRELHFGKHQVRAVDSEDE